MDSENTPQTRAEARDAEQLPTFEGFAYPTPSVELVADPPAPDFLPLPVRRVLFVVGLAALVVAPTVGVNFPEYADAITTGGNLLAAVGLGVALANPTRR